MEITDIKFNGIVEPIGYHFEPLIVSWEVDNGLGKMQKEASLQVAADHEFKDIVLERNGDLDSSGETLTLQLKPRARYYVQIRVTAEDGEVAESASFFETGKMDEAWDAEWIGPKVQEEIHPILFKDFELSQQVKEARLYISGVGLYEASLNGKKIGNDVLAPFVNNYDAFIQIQTYDVTEQLKQSNQLAILLGNGWYKGRFGLSGENAYFGDKFAAIAELVVRYENGTEERIVTDLSWKAALSDITSSGIYDGETIDRTLDKAGRSDEVAFVSIPKEKLKDRISPGLSIHEVIPLKEVIKTPNGETVIDFGQNFAGWLAFDADFPAGTEVHFEFGEILQQGNFYNENYGTATAGFRYISNGEAETVHPHFTYFGFRYVRVTGWPADKEIAVRGLAIYSDMTRTGIIETGNAKVNQLYANSLWGLKSNFLDMPTDCPQRAERLGWTGDAQVFAPTASYHMDTRAFYRKYLIDMRTEQEKLSGSIPNYMPAMATQGGAAVWGDAATFIPKALWTAYGNTEEVGQYYPLMKDWVDWTGSQIEKVHGSKTELNAGRFQFGDWLALDGATSSSFKGSTDDTFIASAYYYESLCIVADVAALMGNESDADYYRGLSEQVRERILFEYVTPSGRLSIDTQSGYIIALKFKLFREREVVIEQLKTRLKKDLYKIKSGFVGTPIFCQVLSENGMVDLAYEFLLNEGFPGWLYAVNLGATTIWERWNSVMPDGTMNPAGMNSLNHYSYGSVIEFVYKYVVGIQPLEVGFRTARLAPNPNVKLGYARGSYQSAAGKFVSEWKILENGELSCYFEVPFGAQAEIVLPYSEREPIKVASGIYEYTYQPTKDLSVLYDSDTRLSIIKNENKELFEEILGIHERIRGFMAFADEEQLNLSLNQLSKLFYTGITAEMVAEADRLFKKSNRI